jgi:copper resistance protein C
MTGGVLLRRATAAALAALLVLLSLVLVAAFATPASAHAELDNTVPADGATVTQTPGSLQLSFSEPIDAELASLVVRSPGGRDLTAGPARQSGSGLIQPITESPKAGPIQVSYRVVSLDGHPVTGSYSFEVLRGNPDAARAEPGSAAASGAGDDDSGVSLTGPLLGAGAVLLLLVAGAVLARRRRDGQEGPAQAPAETTAPPVR